MCCVKELILNEVPLVGAQSGSAYISNPKHAQKVFRCLNMKELFILNHGPI